MKNEIGVRLTEKEKKALVNAIYNSIEKLAGINDEARKEVRHLKNILKKLKQKPFKG